MSNSIYDVNVEDANLLLMDKANEKWEVFTPISAEKLPEFHEKLNGVYKNSSEIGDLCYKLAKLWSIRPKIEAIQKVIKNSFEPQVKRIH